MLYLCRGIFHVIFFKEKTAPQLERQHFLGLLSQLYQNEAFRRYLDVREQYLMETGMNQFIEGKPLKADRIAGQLIEIRALRKGTRSAFLALKKLRDTPLKKVRDKS